MENLDLHRAMAHYRQEAKKVVIKYNTRKIGAMVIALFLSFVALRLTLYWLITLSFLAYLVLYFREYFKEPALRMNDAFYEELAKLQLEDQDALAVLKASLKSKAFLYLDEVEDFIEQEIKTRALNKELATKGAQELLNKE